jgi:hypothetical protein
MADKLKRIKADLSNIIGECVRADATEAEMADFAKVRDEVATLLNRRLERGEDQAAVLSILLMQMFGGKADDIAPEPS